MTANNSAYQTASEITESIKAFADVRATTPARPLHHELRDRGKLRERRARRGRKPLS